MVLSFFSYTLDVNVMRRSVSSCTPNKNWGLQQIPLQGRREITSKRVHRFARNQVITASSFKDPYDVLGVKRSATLKEIKQAFRKKALKLHPDVNKAPDAKERFMECKTAYQAVSYTHLRAHET